MDSIDLSQIGEILTSVVSSYSMCANLSIEEAELCAPVGLSAWHAVVFACSSRRDVSDRARSVCVIYVGRVNENNIATALSPTSVPSPGFVSGAIALCRITLLGPSFSQGPCGQRPTMVCHVRSISLLHYRAFISYISRFSHRQLCHCLLCITVWSELIFISLAVIALRAIHQPAS